MIAPEKLITGGYFVEKKAWLEDEQKKYAQKQVLKK